MSSDVVPSAPAVSGEVESVLEAVDLKKYYDVGEGFVDSLLRRSGRQVHAVDGVSLELGPRETLDWSARAGAGSRRWRAC